MSTQTIKLTTPAGLLAHIPYTLGFTPTDSLVAVSLRGPNSRLGLVARVDLTDAPHAARALAKHMDNNGAHRVIVVTYTPDQTAARGATDALIGELVPGQWFQGWQVTTTGYRALYNDEPLRPLEEITTNAEAVRMIVEGVALASSAADLLPQPASDDQQNDAVSAGDGWTSEDHTPTEAFALWQTATTPGANLTAAMYGELGAALERKTVRDAVLVAMIPGCPDHVAAQVANDEADPEAVGRALGAILDAHAGVAPGQVAEAHAAILAQVIAHTQYAAEVVPAWTLWGLIQWWRGDGVRSGAALRTALDIDPNYRLAQLVTQALEAGLAPGWLRH